MIEVECEQYSDAWYRARLALREVQAFIERRLPDEIGDALTETHDVLALIHHVLYDL